MPAWRYVQIVVVSLSLLLVAFLSAKSHAAERFDVISKLKHWQTQTAFRQDLELREKDQRIQFINRLIFQVERKFRDGPLKAFLVQTLNEMIETDQSRLNQSLGNQEEFLLALKDSLETLLEKKEDPLHFVQAFTEFSGVEEPATADEFAETRSYFDGRQVLAAKPISLEEAAAIVDEKQRALEPSEKKWFDYKNDLQKEFTPGLSLPSENQFQKTLQSQSLTI